MLASVPGLFVGIIISALLLLSPFTDAARNRDGGTFAQGKANEARGAGSVWRKLRPSSIPASIQVANKACIKCKCPCGDTTGRAWDDHEYCRLTGHPKYRECYRACMDGCSSAIRNDVQNKLAWSRKNSGRP
eukprot:GHVU01133988.1.p1 GENE.GHVU01133988.1~~GHVU01133988.1.p1  ORF type:complete len:132 (-),score=11.48 GHVU01133988.1:2486-2881(-)